MAQDDPNATTDPDAAIAEARAMIARHDQRVTAEAMAAAVKRADDREEGLSELRALVETKSYQAMRDKIDAILAKFHGDAIVGNYVQFAALEEFARVAR